jgi:DNA-binding response OmpR family regulator
VDGLILLSDLKQGADVPIIICSSRAGRVDRVLGLRLGADDFIARPFDPEELLARVRSVLRRRLGTGVQISTERAAEREIRLGTLLIEIAPDGVIAHGERVHLTPTEHRLLVVLASQAGQTLTRAEIAKTLWPDKGGGTGSINFHICRLRAKLARAGLSEPAIVAVRSVGYKLDPGSTPP